jgi:hypothetical protein
MVVENTFVTTLEAQDALDRVHRLLEEHGFESVQQTGFNVDANQVSTFLEMTRGRKNAKVNTCAVDCPQRLCLEWNRGRVTLANSIHTARKPKQTHRDLGMLLSRTIQLSLVQADQAEESDLELKELEASIRRKHRRGVIIRWSILGLFLAGVGLLITAAALGWFK